MWIPELRTVWELVGKVIHELRNFISYEFSYGNDSKNVAR